MPEICRFFGIIIRMFFDEHNPPHFHAEYQGKKAVFDFLGNITRGDLRLCETIKLTFGWKDFEPNRSQIFRAYQEKFDKDAGQKLTSPKGEPILRRLLRCSSLMCQRAHRTPRALNSPQTRFSK